MAISGKVGAVYVQTSAAPASFTDEVTNPFGNLLTKNQSSVEIDTTGLTQTLYSSVMTRDTTEAWQGAASLKVTAGGGSGRLGFNVTPSGTASVGQIFTASVYIKGSGNLIGKQGWISIKESSATSTETTKTFTFTNNWQRVDVTHTILRADTTFIKFYINDNTGQGTVNGDVFYADGLQVEIGNKATSWTEGVDRTKFRIADTAKQYFDKNSVVTVKKNNVIQTSGFKLDYIGGIVNFDNPIISTDTVTLSGNYLTVAQAGGFFNWSLDAGADTSEVTTFQSNGWKEHQATLKEWSVSAEAYWGNGDFFDKLGTECVVLLYLDTSANLRFEGYGIVTGDGIETAIDSVIQESIDIQGNGALYLREVA